MRDRCRRIPECTVRDKISIRICAGRIAPSVEMMTPAARPPHRAPPGLRLRQQAEPETVVSNGQDPVRWILQPLMQMLEQMIGDGDPTDPDVTEYERGTEAEIAAQIA